MKLEKILAIATFIMIVTVAVWAALRPELIPRFNLVLLAGLIAVTTVYAYSTIKIARHSEKQTEEMEKQLLSEARPYILIRLKKDKEADPIWQWPSNFEVMIKNAGKGPAINLVAALWYRGKEHFWQERRGYLALDDDWETTIKSYTYGVVEPQIWLPELAEKMPYCTGAIVVEYQDIHKRMWASYLCLDEELVDTPETYVIEGEQNIVEIKKND